MHAWRTCPRSSLIKAVLWSAEAARIVACTARQPHFCIESSHTRPLKFAKATSISPTSSNMKMTIGRFSDKLVVMYPSRRGLDALSAQRFALVCLTPQRPCCLFPAKIPKASSVLRGVVLPITVTATEHGGRATAVLFEDLDIIHRTQDGLRGSTTK